MNESKRKTQQCTSWKSWEGMQLREHPANKSNLWTNGLRSLIKSLMKEANCPEKILAQIQKIYRILNKINNHRLTLWQFRIFEIKRKEKTLHIGKTRIWISCSFTEAKLRPRDAYESLKESIFLIWNYLTKWDFLRIWKRSIC